MELLHHGLLDQHGNMNPHLGMEKDFSLTVHQCIISSRLEEYLSNGNRNISLAFGVWIGTCKSREQRFV